MKLYENIAIGNFLYGLGFAIAHRIKGAELPSVVSLLQQTPDDRRLGDVFMKFPGTLRILEFKQKNNHDDKEPGRHRHLQATLKNMEDMTRVSREVHWFVETAPTDDSFVSRIVPYLDAYPRDNSQHDFVSFINETADMAVSEESKCTESELKEYLDVIASTHKAGSVGSGGLIVKMAPNGDLRFVELASILELRLSRNEIVAERSRQQEKMLELERQLEPKNKPTPTKSKENDFGIDM